MEHLLDHVPEEYHKAFLAIAELLDDFCARHLNDDYHQLSLDVAINFCQKGSPANRGKPAGWACGIVHALGMVNFLQDASFEPYLSAGDLAQGFGVSKGTMAGKSKIVRDMLDMGPCDPRWCLPELMAQNPRVWMLEVDGLIVDVRSAPLEVQQLAYEKGLIPYVPAERNDDDEEDFDEPQGNSNILQFPGVPGHSAEKNTKAKPADDGPSLFDGLED